MSDAKPATVVEAASSLVPIEYAIFYVSSDHDGGPDGHEPPAADEVVAVLARSTLAIASACSDHEAQVALQRWTGEPPALPIRAGEAERGAAGRWELRRDLRADLAPGPFRPAAIMSTPIDAGVGIPAAGPYQIRLCSRGRQRVREAVRQAIADLDPTVTTCGSPGALSSASSRSGRRGRAGVPAQLPDSTSGSDGGNAFVV